MFKKDALENMSSGLANTPTVKKLNGAKSHTLLFLINHYYNAQEVNDFLRQLEEIPTPNLSIVTLVCDNSGGFTLDKNLATTVLVPPENKGYLGGCAYAFQTWIEQGNPTPDFTAISNTDLELPANFIELFENISNDIGLISSKVKDRNGRYQNPHLKERLSSKSIKRYMQIFRFPIVGSFYLLLNQLKRNLSNSKDLNIDIDSNTGSQELYAAHGSIFFLTKAFFESGGKLSNWSLLYGEELYIAEQLLALNLKAICNNRVTVIHNAHSTTKLLSLTTKSKHFYQGYKAIYDRFLFTPQSSI